VQGSCCRRHCGPVDPGEELAHGLCGGDQSLAVPEPLPVAKPKPITLPVAKPVTNPHDTLTDPNHAITDTHHTQPVPVS